MSNTQTATDEGSVAPTRRYASGSSGECSGEYSGEYTRVVAGVLVSPSPDTC